MNCSIDTKKAMRNGEHKLRIPEEIVKLIRGMHPHLKHKVKRALKTIINEPTSGKALKDELNGLRSLRVSVSRFRIIFRISRKGEMEIVALGPRKSIYEETFRLIEKEREK